MKKLLCLVAIVLMSGGCASTFRAITPDRAQMVKEAMAILTAPTMERSGVCSFSSVIDGESVIVQFSAYALNELVKRHEDGLIDPCSILGLGDSIKARGAFNDDGSVFTATEIHPR